MQTYAQKSETTQRVANNNAAHLMDTSLQNASLQRKANMMDNAIQRASLEEEEEPAQGKFIQRKTDMIQQNLNNNRNTVIQRLGDEEFRVENPNNLENGYVEAVKSDIYKKKFVKVGVTYHITGRSMFACSYKCDRQDGDIYVFEILTTLQHGPTNKHYKDGNGKRFQIDSRKRKKG